MTTRAALRSLSNRTLFSPLGLELQRVRTNVERPWESTAFAPLLEEAQANTLLDPQRLWMLAEGFRACAMLPGDVAEFGAYRGGSSVLLARLIAALAPDKTLHAFDSFEGFPEPDAIDLHERGQLANTSAAHVSAVLAPTGARHAVHAGFFGATLPAVADRTWCFVHLDADLYSSTMEVLTAVWDRVTPGGIVVGDDYGFTGEPGAKRAIDEFGAQRGVWPMHLPTGQAMLVKQAR